MLLTYHIAYRETKLISKKTDNVVRLNMGISRVNPLLYGMLTTLQQQLLVANSLRLLKTPQRINGQNEMWRRCVIRVQSSCRNDWKINIGHSHGWSLYTVINWRWLEHGKISDEGTKVNHGAVGNPNGEQGIQPILAEWWNSVSLWMNYEKLGSSFGARSRDANVLLMRETFFMTSGT